DTRTCIAWRCGFFVAAKATPNPFRRACRAGGWSWVRLPRCCFALGCSTCKSTDEEPSHGHEESCEEVRQEGDEAYRPQTGGQEGRGQAPSGEEGRQEDRAQDGPQDHCAEGCEEDHPQDRCQAASGEEGRGEEDRPQEHAEDREEGDPQDCGQAASGEEDRAQGGEE